MSCIILACCLCQIYNSFNRIADHCQADPQLFVESQQMPSSTHRNDKNRSDAEQTCTKEKDVSKQKKTRKNSIRSVLNGSK